MEQCIKCKKEFEVKDLFLQWVTTGEGYVCRDCIEKYKQYYTDTGYASDLDITFVFAVARIPLDNNDFVELSQTLIGYHYGHPEDNEGYKAQMLQNWLKYDEQIRIDLLRQSFNENQKDEEILY